MQASSLPPTSQRQIQPGTTDLFALGRTGTSLHPELRSALRLNTAHQQKIYYSSRLSKRVERCTDGTRPKDEGWADVWCQLAGVGLSIWSMQAMKHANARGEGVPLQYINVADAVWIQIYLAMMHSGGTRGSNLLLFVCESPAVLISWAAALRLAAWEKSRLEEIYTAHLLRIAFTEVHVWKEPRTTLVNGRLEGWVRVRVANQTEWRRYWLVISAGSPSQPPGTLDNTPSIAENNSQPTPGLLSWLFSRSSHSHASSIGSAGDMPNMRFFNSSEPKDRKSPVLTVSSVTQAFAVYPERSELITRSTLVKIEGRLGREEGAGAIKGTGAWVLIMPEVENGQPAIKMLEWVVALHDAFELYGRPQQYSFNPYDPTSMFFAYPLKTNPEPLFLGRELAETLDPRHDLTSLIRSRLAALVLDRLKASRSVSGVGSDVEQPGVTEADTQAQPKSERLNATDYASHSPDSATAPFLTGNATDYAPHSPGPIPAPFPTANATDYAPRSSSPALPPFLTANATDNTPQSPNPIPVPSLSENATDYAPRSSSPVSLPSPAANATDYARYTSVSSVADSLVANATDRFAQIDLNETMTKASTLRDTLPAGVQDTHDRPAKNREALSPISGPESHTLDKPPPPQTNLLGAIAAHERERRIAGLLRELETLAPKPGPTSRAPNEPPPPQTGVLATIVGHECEREHERERRVAELQREHDDARRQQPAEVEQLIYAGGMYGMNPMMNGMGSMGALGPMGMLGFNPMMDALDPQQRSQILAAQRAAVEAYQRTLMSFSQSGSVAPGQHDGGGHGASAMPGQ